MYFLIKSNDCQTSPIDISFRINSLIHQAITKNFQYMKLGQNDSPSPLPKEKKMKTTRFHQMGTDKNIFEQVFHPVPELSWEILIFWFSCLEVNRSTRHKVLMLSQYWNMHAVAMQSIRIPFVFATFFYLTRNKEFFIEFEEISLKL